MKKIIKNPMSLAGLIIILIIGVLAIFAGYLSPFDPNYININAILCRLFQESVLRMRKA